MNLKEFFDQLDEGWAGKRGVPDGSGPAPGMSGMGRRQGNCDKGAVMSAALDAAEDIFGADEVDEKKVSGIVNAAIKKAKDTEEAIQIAIDMMRSE